MCQQAGIDFASLPGEPAALLAALPCWLHCRLRPWDSCGHPTLRPSCLASLRLPTPAAPCSALCSALILPLSLLTPLLHLQTRGLTSSWFCPHSAPLFSLF
jgi:hypothetical protein